MNEKDYDKILKILLSADINYAEILEVAQNFVADIVKPHINEFENKYPSEVTQAILECFKNKYNFSSNKWYSAKRVDKNSVKQNCEPIKFKRLITNGETVEYELYNFSQLNIEEDKEDEVKTVEIKADNDSDKIKIITDFVKEYDGMYGKGGIAKILKGSTTIKDNEFNQKAKASKYYGILDYLTQKELENIIEELVEKEVLKKIKGSFARPLIKFKNDIQIKKDLPEQQENEDENVKKISKLISNNENIFITGHAGTGKSWLLNELKIKFPDIVVTSTTGIAATNIKGQTLHSWAGVGICNKPIDKAVESILKKTTVKNQIIKCKMLAIDEISMLDIKTFEYVDKVFKLIRNSNKPFGGIEVILIGDFYQLPPVNKDNSEIRYCFESPLWKEMKLKTVLLTKNYRQSEENLIKALSNMRINELEKEDIELLKSREYSNKEELSDILHIFATNAEAERFNTMKFQSINSKIYTFSAIDCIYKGGKPKETPDNEKEEMMFNRIDTLCNAEKIIQFKSGERVMLLFNLDFKKGLINGSVGNILEIEEDYIKVKFDNGVIEDIERHDFEFYNNEILIAKREQFPLKPAYGITIHKSQGMSLDKLVVDCSRIFEKGQVYVALSRIKTLKGLYLYNFSPRCVMVDEKVASFYKTLETV